MTEFKDVQITKLCSLNIEELKHLFTYTLEALEKVLKLIDSNPNINANIKRMEYITYGLGYYVFNDKLNIFLEADMNTRIQIGTLAPLVRELR